MIKIKTLAAVAAFLLASTVNADGVVYLECNYLNGDNKPAKILVTADESAQTVTHSGVSDRVKAIFSPADLTYKTDKYSIHAINRSTLAYTRTFTIGAHVSTESGTCEITEAPKERKF